MRLLFCIMACLLPVFSLAQDAGSSGFAALAQRLQEYYPAMERESLEQQKNECDFLIESTADSLLRQFVALDIYEHFLESPLMGSENVAVHVYDKWFADGKIAMRTEADLYKAKTYADFNRQSLIGSQAPRIALYTPSGEQSVLFDDSDSKDKYRVLYLYDTDCVKCTLQSSLIRDLLYPGKYPVELYAVYVGDNHKDWMEYIAGKFADDGRKCTVRHLWDPYGEADLQQKYALTQTPRLFLIGPGGTIIGRGLDAKALKLLLETCFSEKQLEYGTPEGERLFEGIFSASGGDPTVGEVKGIADYIHDRTLGRGDTLMFRQMSGDYLYYLAARSGEGIKEGLKYHIDKNILADNGVWISADDSLKVIGFARIMGDLLSKAAPGTRITPLKVPGELYAAGKSPRKGTFRLDRLNGDVNYIMFVTDGCEICAAQKKSAQEIAAPRNNRGNKSGGDAKVLIINMDNLISAKPDLAARLMDVFDLSSLPYTVITDSDGNILRRYFFWHTL